MNKKTVAGIAGVGLAVAGVIATLVLKGKKNHEETVVEEENSENETNE